MDNTNGSQTRRRSGRQNRTANPQNSVASKYTPPIAGRLKPLSDEALERVHLASLDILDQIGINEAHQVVIDTIQAHG